MRRRSREAETGIATLNAAAKNLLALADLLPKLELASDSLSRHPSPLPRTDPRHSGAPPLAGEATKLLEVKKLTLDDLSTLVTTKVPDMVKLIGDWQAREGHVADYERALEAFKPDDLSPDQRTILRNAFECLASVWDRLWEAKAVTAFVADNIDRDLTSVHGSIADLHVVPHRIHFDAALSYARERTLTVRPDLENLIFFDVLRSELSPSSVTRDAARAAARSAATEPTSADMVKQLKDEGFRREMILATIGFLIALFTGLNALYMGKAWGTWLDYVNAILWALTATAALTLILVPALDQLAKLKPLGRLIRT